MVGREGTAELFGLDAIEGYDDLGDLGPINERASAHGSRLDRLEEESYYDMPGRE